MSEDKELILLIEDEPQMRRFLRITLQSQGYRLVESETAQDGLMQAAIAQSRRGAARPRAAGSSTDWK